MMPEPPMNTSLREHVRQDLAALARARRRRMLAFAVAGLLLSFGLGLLMGVKAPMAGTWPHWATLAGFAAGGLTLYGYALGIKFIARSALMPAIGIGVAATAGLMALGVGKGTAAAPPFLAGAMCMGHGMAAAAAIIIVALLLGRRVMRRHAPTGLLMGVGGGMLGVIPLHLACVHDDAAHLMVWHALVPVMAGLLGGIIWLLMEPDAEE